MMKKSLLSLFLIFCLILISTNPLSVFAQNSGSCGDDLTWTLDTEGTLTISGTGSMYNYSLRQPPWQGLDVKSIVMNEGITRIGVLAFSFCPELKSVKIANTVESIGASAFKCCDSLENITIPDGVAIIEQYAFLDCDKLSNITIPDSVTTIEHSAFENCDSLSSIYLPANIKSIDSSLFADCDNLTSISIPKNVDSIMYEAFNHCDKLSRIYIPNSVRSIYGQAFNQCPNLTDVFYNGTEESWNKISVAAGNDSLKNSRISFKSYITVEINGRNIRFEQIPVIINGRTLVPLRTIFEKMGATVNWDNNTKTVTSELDSTTIQLTIGSNVLYKNGTGVTLDVPAQLINGYTMIPVRAVAEAFGANVEWNENDQIVCITTKGNNYTVDTVPQFKSDDYYTNFADFSGMYIDSFAHNTNSNGTENIKFDVYNTQYIYGLVEIYNANGNLEDVAIIDKMSNSTNIKGVLIDDTGRLIKDIWNSTLLTYRQESGYSKKTSINIDIPKGGYIKITNDMSESFLASAINLSDLTFAANNTFSTLNGFNNETSKNFAYELSLKLITETAFTEAIKVPEEFTKNLWKDIGKELYMNPESTGDFLNTISKNIDEFANGKLSEIIISTAKNCGIGIAERTFKALAGPAGATLKAMFAITVIHDFLIEMNDGLDCLHQGSINIQTQ